MRIRHRPNGGQKPYPEIWCSSQLNQSINAQVAESRSPLDESTSSPFNLVWLKRNESLVDPDSGSNVELSASRPLTTVVLLREDAPGALAKSEGRESGKSSSPGSIMGQPPLAKPVGSFTKSALAISGRDLAMGITNS